MTIRQNLQFKGIFIGKYCEADLQVWPMTQVYEFDNVKPAVAKVVCEYEIMHIIWTLIFCDNLLMCLLTNLIICI